MKNPFLGGASVTAAVANLDESYAQGDISRKEYTGAIKNINNSFGTKYKANKR
jgi:hypothetical protein